MPSDSDLLGVTEHHCCKGETRMAASVCFTVCALTVP